MNDDFVKNLPNRLVGVHAAVLVRDGADVSAVGWESPKTAAGRPLIDR
jgi:hypothetical protein